MIEGARRGKTHENTENKEENKIRDSGGDKKEYKKGGRGGEGDEKKLLPKGASEHDGETWWVCIHAHRGRGSFCKDIMISSF